MRGPRLGQLEEVITNTRTFERNATRESEVTVNVEIFMSTNPMTSITLKLTREEAELLTSLVADQLFRREFIDPKMPGFKSNTSEVTLGKALVARLRSIVDPDRAQRALPAKVAR